MEMMNIDKITQKVNAVVHNRQYRVNLVSLVVHGRAVGRYAVIEAYGYPFEEIAYRIHKQLPECNIIPQLKS